VGAVEAGQFHVWAVKTINQGIEVLTGVEAGERQVEGGFPEGSVNDLVDCRLQELGESIKKSEPERK